MKAIRFHEYGGPEVLQLEEVEAPVPGPGQVRVRVAGTSFNGVDGNIRAGFMQGPMPLTLPHVPGLDVAGTVEELGAGVTELQVGDRVVGFLPFVVDGAAAEQVVVEADALTRAPATIPLADAAALPVVGLTAWQALFAHAGLTSGQRLLVVGAGGAVGGYAVQLAVAAGAHVVAVAGARSREQLLAWGVDEVLDRTTDLGAALPDGVDAVLNLAPVEPAELEALVGLVRDGGVLVNTTVWMPAPSDAARGVRGIDLYVASDRDQLAQLVRRVDAGQLEVTVARRVPLAELPTVHADAAAGTLSGKVVVVP